MSLERWQQWSIIARVLRHEESLVSVGGRVYNSRT